MSETKGMALEVLSLTRIAERIGRRELVLPVLAAVLVVGAPALLSLVTYDACAELHDDHDEWPDMAALHERAESLEWAYAAEANTLRREVR